MSPNLLGQGHNDLGADPIGIGVIVSIAVELTLVCTIYCVTVVGFLPKFYGYITGT